MKRLYAEHRGQDTLLPESLDYYVSDTNPVRVVDVEVTTIGSDRDQLSSMAKQAREAIASETLSVVADRVISHANKSWLATMPASPPMCPNL